MRRTAPRPVRTAHTGRTATGTVRTATVARTVAAGLAAGAVALGGVLAAATPAAAAAPPDPRLVPYITLADRAPIPAAAMLQPQDLRGAPTTPADADAWTGLRPPQPCTDRRYPSGALERTDRAVQAMIGYNERPTVVMEHVAVYRLGGALLYLSDLRRALAACPAPGPLDPRWTVRATGLAGDESMLLEKREYIDYTESWKNTYVLVARTGRALVVVADAGWEEGSGHEALVRELAPRAVTRAAVLNRPF